MLVGIEECSKVQGDFFTSTIGYDYKYLCGSKQGGGRLQYIPNSQDAEPEGGS